MITIDSSELHAAADALRTADAGVQSGDVVGEAVQPLADQWPAAVAARQEGAQDAAVLFPSPGLVEGASLILEAAASTVPLSGGLVPSELWPAVEFGSDRPGLPPKSPAGRVVIPAGRELGEQYEAVAGASIEATYVAAVGE